MNMDYRRWTVVASVIAGSIAVAIGLIQGDIGPALTFVMLQGVALSLLLWLTRPRLGGAHISHAAAQAAAGDDDVILYWRPG